MLPATAARVARELFGLERGLTFADRSLRPGKIRPFKHLLTRVEEKQLDQLFDIPSVPQPSAPQRHAEKQQHAAKEHAVTEHVSIEDFNKFDLRVAKITKAEHVEGAGLESGRPVLDALFSVIEQRRRDLPEGSYTASLFKRGMDRIAQKVIEEAGETAIAAKNPEQDRVISEMADLWYHSLVLLSARGLTPEDVWAELGRRRQ